MAVGIIGRFKRTGGAACKSTALAASEGESMSENQKTQAERILDWAEHMVKVMDSFSVYQQGLHKLNQLGLNTYDITDYKRRLEKVAGLK